LQVGSALGFSVNGSIDELSVYPTELSADRIAAHYQTATACTQLTPTSTAVQLEAYSNYYVGAMAEDTLNLYWMDQSGQSLYRMPKAGGVPFALASGFTSAGTGLAVDSSYAYWVDDGAGNGAGTVSKVSLDGGAPILLASGQDSPVSLAVDATNVYWANRVIGGAIMQASKVDGSNPIVLHADGGDYPYSLTIDSQNVYWTSNNTPSGQLGSGSVNLVPIDGGLVQTLTSAGEPSSVAVDANNIYFGDFGAWSCCNFSALDGIGNIWKLPKGSTTPILLSSGQSQPQYVTIDSQNVYWTNYRNGSVASVPIDGGVTTTLDSWGFCSGGVVVDPTSLYFSPCGDVEAITPP
jgi:hypothetical protein